MRDDRPPCRITPTVRKACRPGSSARAQHDASGNDEDARECREGTVAQAHGDDAERGDAGARRRGHWQKPKPLQEQPPLAALHATQSVSAAHGSAQEPVRKPQIIGARHSRDVVQVSPNWPLPPPPPPPPVVTHWRSPLHDSPGVHDELSRQPARQTWSTTSQYSLPEQVRSEVQAAPPGCTQRPLASLHTCPPLHVTPLFTHVGTAQKPVAAQNVVGATVQSFDVVHGFGRSQRELPVLQESPRLVHCACSVQAGRAWQRKLPSQ
jgi:hypothetical protein